MLDTDTKDSSEKYNNSAPQKIHLESPFPQQIAGDSINLYELWITLWDKKWLVIAVTVLAAFGSVVYALHQPSIYKVEALVLRPSLKNVQALNQKYNLSEARLGEQSSLLPIRSEVFSTFKKNLSSRNLQKKFILEHDLLKILAPGGVEKSTDREILNSFSKMIKIEAIEVGFSLEEGFKVTMESSDPEFASRIVNDYISFFDMETINALVVAMHTSIESQIKDIEYTIKSKRKMALIRRQDQIERFEEAANIASSLGAKERIEATNVVTNNTIGTIVKNQSALTPLYYLGSKAIEAEIVTLENRKSDDPFIVGLRDLEENLSLLRSIKIKREGLRSVTIDQDAYPPKDRIRPNRRMIASFGTVMGCFTGIILAFLISFIQKQKENYFE